MTWKLTMGHDVNATSDSTALLCFPSVKISASHAYYHAETCARRTNQEETKKPAVATHVHYKPSHDVVICNFTERLLNNCAATSRPGCTTVANRLTARTQFFTLPQFVIIL